MKSILFPSAHCSRWITWPFKEVHAANFYDWHRYFVSRLPIPSHSISINWPVRFFTFFPSLHRFLFLLTSYLAFFHVLSIDSSSVCSQIHFRYRRYRYYCAARLAERKSLQRSDPILHHRELNNNVMLWQRKLARINNKGLNERRNEKYRKKKFDVKKKNDVSGKQQKK